MHLMMHLHKQLPDWHMPGELLRNNRANALLLGTHGTLVCKSKIIIIIIFLYLLLKLKHILVQGGKSRICN